MDRNSVRSVADLELKGEGSAGKDLERARIGRGEGGVGGGARMKTKGAERSSGGRSGGVSVEGG